MTRYYCSEGELCLQTHDVGCQAPGNVGVKSTTIEHAGIMSRWCSHFRLHRYVRITPTCWIWTGTFYSQFGQPTYGQFLYDGRRMGAHRASYLIHGGTVPDGLDVLHSCDVKACVNPAHLRPGTHAENIREAFAKLPAGHFAGENNGRGRLTWDDVHTIRAAIAAGAKQADLAHQYEVAQAHISHIANGKRWLETTCPVHGSVEVAA